jgi:hypothetical protein
MVIRRIGLCAVAFGSCLGAAIGLRSLLLFFDPLASSTSSFAAIAFGCVLATIALWIRSGQPDRLRVVGAFVVPALVLAVGVMVAPLLLAIAMGVYLGSDAITQSFAVAAGVMTLAGAVALVRTLGLARAVTLVLLSLLGLASFAPVGAAAEPVVLDVTAPMLFGFTNAAAIGVALVLAVAAGAWAAFMYADAAGRGVEAERSLT